MPDAMPDVPDAMADGGTDIPVSDASDAPTDRGPDAPVDVAPDASDAMPDHPTGMDATPDAVPEAGMDGGNPVVTYLSGQTFAGTYPSVVATDSVGDLFLGGSFGAGSDVPIELRQLNIAGTVFTPSAVDGYVARLSGAHLWARQVTDGDGMEPKPQGVASIAADGAGHVVAVGSGVDGINLGPEIDFIPADKDGYQYVVSYDASTGTPVWVQAWSLGGVGLGSIQSLALDPGDNSIIISGVLARSSGSATAPNLFGCLGALKVALSSSTGPGDAFVAKLSPTDGSCVWVQRFGADATTAPDGDGGTSITGNVEVANSVAVDSSGRITVVGSYSAGFAIGSLPALPASTLPGSAFFAARFDKDGTPMWSRGFPNAKTDGMAGIPPSATPGAGAMAIGSDGSLVATGFFRGSLDFGGGPLVTPDSGLGNAFIVKLDNDGQHVWSRQFGDSQGMGSSSGLAVAIDASKNALVGGVVHGSIGNSLGPSVSPYGDPFLVLLDGATGANLVSLQSVGDKNFGPSATTSVVISPSDGSWWVSGHYFNTLRLDGIDRPELTTAKVYPQSSPLAVISTGFTFLLNLKR